MAKRNKKRKKIKQTATPSIPVKKKKKAFPSVKEAIPNRWKWAIGAAMAVLAMAIYSPSINYGFVYDDDAVIKDNRFVKQGLAGLDEIWSTSYFEGYDENMIARAFRPVPLSTLAFEVEMFGLNTKVHHAANILFYGLTGLFLFLFLSKLMRGHHPFFAHCHLFVVFAPSHPFGGSCQYQEPGYHARLFRGLPGWMFFVKTFRHKKNRAFVAIPPFLCHWAFFKRRSHHNAGRYPAHALVFQKI